MLKRFLLKKMMKNQGLPEEHLNKFLDLIEKNPELFKKIALEVQEKVKNGTEQQTASLEVMQKYQAELQKLL